MLGPWRNWVTCVPNRVAWICKGSTYTCKYNSVSHLEMTPSVYETLCKSSAIMHMSRDRDEQRRLWMRTSGAFKCIPEARAPWCYYGVSVMFCNTRKHTKCWCCLCWHRFAYTWVNDVFISKLSHTSLSPPAPKSQTRLMQMCIYMCVCVCLPSPSCLHRFQEDSLSHLVNHL